MRHIKHWLALYLTLVFSVVSAAGIEVKKNANIYKEPSRHSEKLLHIDIDEVESPYWLILLSTDRVSGYYHVRTRSGDQHGWIYKSLVRPYQGQHPDYIPYKRSLYTHWTDDDRDCQNTRAEVLIRDSTTTNLEFKSEAQCLVLKGEWIGPYSGNTFTIAKDLDVDHVVPLHNAHESGAWAWTKAKRREYANYLVDQNHLLAVKASENRRKGSKGPDKYMPPRTEYHCDYVRIWQKIKRDWELEMTEDEGEAVQTALDACT